MLRVIFTSLVASSILVIIPFATPSRADQVSSLTTKAKAVSQQLIQDQLEAGAYQQQYSLASAKVAADQKNIAATKLQIARDTRAISVRDRDLRRLALMSYVLNGSVSSTSGASLFAENVDTIQSANEYSIITDGNLNEALAELHTSEHAVQAQKAVLVKQQSEDQAEQALQGGYLSQANATTGHLQATEAEVTGQLAQAVALQQAADAAAAAAAVAAAEQAAEAREVDYVPTNTVDPVLNAFLQCVVQAESGGNYAAVSPNGEYMGAFQFDQPTWNYAAQAAGRDDLVGVPPNVTSKPDQDTVAVALYSLDGERPWLGDRCGSS